jgi:hypothetical protein
MTGVYEVEKEKPALPLYAYILTVNKQVCKQMCEKKTHTHWWNTVVSNQLTNLVKFGSFSGS